MSSVSGQVPVLANLDLPLRKLEQVPGGKLVDAGKGGFGIGDIAKVKVLKQSLAIQIPEFGRGCQNGLDFRAEEQAPLDQSVVKGFLSETIAGDQQRPATFIIKGKCKHPTQLLNAIRTEVFVKMDDDFGVRIRVEAMAAGFQFRAEFREIINLTIEDHPNGLVLVVDGLAAAA